MPNLAAAVFSVVLRVATACALALVFALSAVARITPVEAGPQYLRGIDVSKWQGAINWTQVANDGISFAIARASYGSTGVDPWYAENHAGAEAAGIAFGAYHYANPDKTPADAVAEADHFVDSAELQGSNLVPVLDLESTGGLGPRKLRAWARAWLGRVEERLGVKASIYTSRYFWRDRMGNSQWFSNNGHRLWIAHWGVEQPKLPAQNWAGRGWTLWQHSSQGRVAGIDGPVDLDRYRGTDLGALRITSNR
jgi:lysozyme